MQHTSKLFLAIVGGGILLGAALGNMSNPAMRLAPEPEWRDRYRSSYSNVSMQFVDAGPIDLAPPLAWGAPRYGPAGDAYFGPYRPSEAGLVELDTWRENEVPAAYPDAAPEAPPAIQDALEEAATTAARLEPAADTAANLPRPASPDGSEPAPAEQSGTTANAL